MDMVEFRSLIFVLHFHRSNVLKHRRYKLAKDNEKIEQNKHHKIFNINFFAWFFVEIKYNTPIKIKIARFDLDNNKKKEFDICCLNNKLNCLLFIFFT